jgi:hypothetical protein
MGLYSRADYETELDVIEAARVLLTRKLVDGRIDGFKYTAAQKRLDDCGRPRLLVLQDGRKVTACAKEDFCCEAGAKRKLLRTRMTMGEKDIKRKQAMGEAKDWDETKAAQLDAERTRIENGEE